MKISLAISLGILSLCAVAAGATLSFYRYATTPAEHSETKSIVWIRPGQSFSQTVAQLQEAGLVKHPHRFRWLARLTGNDRRLRAGEYLLSTSMTPRGMLDAMVQGRIVLHKVVIPEGSTVFEIGRIVERTELLPQGAFFKAASDRDLVLVLGIEGPTLEGYLFPETYYFPRGVTPREVIGAMVAQFFSIFAPEWVDRARALGLTVHQVVILASMVEKETAKPEERALIAGVFMNRLKQGMRLESDPTVIYGMKDFDGNLTSKDLETPTPYNTYQIDGLPPGPIANPGRASIEAVLYPSEEPYLFFVSRNDGSHHFSRTLVEHRRMVKQYQPSE